MQADECPHRTKSRLKKFWTEEPMSQTKEFVWSAMTVIMFLIIVTLLFGAISGGY